MTARLIELERGVVGVTAHGDPAARRVVLLCHPTPGASDFDPDPVVTGAGDVRLVGADRPGYGSTSAAIAEAGVPEAAELAALDEAVQAGAHIAGVVGWGFGGLIALRVAAARPEHVRRVAVVQAPRPRSKLNGLVARRSRAWMLQHNDPTMALAALHGGTHIEALSVLGVRRADPDLRQPGVPERLGRMLSDAARGGLTGVAFDRRAQRRGDWNDIAGRVRARTLVVHGERDPRIGPADARWFRRRLDRAEVETVIEAGPLSIVTYWARILEFAVRG
ncbi:alpha/beta fold hydrolase [Gryllotalpicola reticulitermitis]|uniref:Alpha/beta fold hydrolase n=1 Tax=Gryllotalpicola reticulitermitis TaxID=1184153 RepID=A0ABV8Q2T5_9MICO